ncbi:double-strand break repair helicase AddA [Ensifer sp. MJa1]|uniref:double-strand break repair helicase AddA n=1 Tax=Ensifer sp. MJa1 TaxID=2919888 RepID=UPI00300B5D78
MRDDSLGPSESTPQAWLDWTSRRQSLASDPQRSAWVSANAGSGKTHVLTQRVIRLLLAGCRPSAILCLTYTKAAASEMSNRVFERLAEWVTLDDQTLEDRIEAIEGERPSLFKLQEARRLFARALETPGGLKIQTIHAFCEALLHQFPLEANVAGHFSVLDDRAAAVLLADARRLLLTATAAKDDAGLARAFATVLDLADDTGLEKLLAAIIENRTAIHAFLERADANGGTEAELRRALKLAPDDSVASAIASVWPLAGLSGAALDRYLSIARDVGGSKVLEFSEGLRTVSRLADPMARYEGLRHLFFTGTGKPRAQSAFLNKAMQQAAPDLADLVDKACHHVVACIDRVSIVQMFEATLSALTLADRLNADYEELKRRRSQLDFEDLINRTAALFARGDVSAWVHYKLDQGIDHILVDEAQDTSPAQWTIIQALAADFFSGESARSGSNRTMFAVGDEKQSIYSFQGARPERFSRESQETERRVRDGGKAFEPIRLQLSFRSTVDVLSAVDAVFANPVHARGLSARNEPVVHASNRIGHPGAVDVWDVIASEPVDTDDEWTAAFDATPESAPVNVLARRIANVLESWIGRETIIEKGVRRPMRPGDVIVLVRKRDAFVNALTRALKRRNNIPVAGADRLVLTKHIAVQDLLALGRFVLLPEDDLSLAALLKSPLLNLGEDALFELAARRGVGESLWQRLQDEAVGGVLFYAAAKTLKSYIVLAGQLAPHDFYARILGVHGGRAAFLARLGTEVSDILDEFLTFALDQEKSGLPGLQAFVSTLEMEAPTVKREQDKERDEVRVMTVHAAKGLEAPVVFLVDGGGKPFNSQHVPDLRFLELSEHDGTVLSLPVWRAPGSASNSLVTADSDRLKALAEEEYRRLLYVGMTRAADRLIVCGYRGQRAVADTWHAMVQASVAQDERGQSITFRAGGEEWSGHAWRDRRVERDVPSKDEPVSEVGRTATGLPKALSTPLPPQKRLPRPLSPSGVGIAVDEDDGDAPIGSALFSAKAPANLSLLRGAILHRLLQVLPSITTDDRRAAAERYLVRSVPRWSADQRAALIAGVENVLDHPDLIALFSAGSRAEVSVMGTLTLGSRDHAVSGRIDRLSVSNGIVTIADFKTNRQVPAMSDDIPFAYRAQLAIYRELLRPLYPGHAFRCVLIFTEGPAIHVVADQALDRSLEDLATK